MSFGRSPENQLLSMQVQRLDAYIKKLDLLPQSSPAGELLAEWIDNIHKSLRETKQGRKLVEDVFRKNLPSK